MRSLFLILTLSLILLGDKGVLAGQVPEKEAEKGPVVITSETLTINKKQNSALFKGSVVAKKGDMTVFADTMLVYYDETGTRIKGIEAEGNVKVIKETKTIISEKAVYIAEDDSITFTGEPVVIDGKNMIKGDKIIYYISEDRSIISHSKVFLKEDTD